MAARTLPYLLPLVLVVAMASPAIARDMKTVAEPSNGPVEITGCRSTLIWLPLSGAYTLRIWVDFKNAGPKTASTVRFLFHTNDASGKAIQSSTGDRVGTFAPGDTIQHWLNSNAGTIVGLPTSIADVTCQVEMVRFEDGSEWHGNSIPTGHASPAPAPTN